MDAMEILVVLGSAGAIAFVLGYFFGEKPREAARTEGGGPQAVTIRVRGGYDPSVVVVRQGQPVRLDFVRDETSACSEQVVLADFGITRDLPAHATTAVAFTPTRAGSFSFTCGMGMLRGTIVVEPA
ncbi:MAG: cupredoxin domain-containing protein [Polyangiales bacterium]